MMIGFKIIKEMTKEELIDELIDVYKDLLQQQELDTLRGNVVSFQLNQVRKNLIEESGIDQSNLAPPWGMEG